MPFLGVGPQFKGGHYKVHSVYVWIPFIFWTSAFLFYLPHIFWKAMENRVILLITRDLAKPNLEDIMLSKAEEDVTGMPTKHFETI